MPRKKKKAMDASSRPLDLGVPPQNDTTNSSSTPAPPPQAWHTPPGKENEKKAMDASSRPLDLGVLPQNDTTNSSSAPAPPPQAWHRPPGKENEKKAMDASSRPLDLGVPPQNDTTNSSSTPAPPPQAWHRPPGKENEKKAMDASSRPLNLGVPPQNDTTNSSSTPAPPPQAWHRPPGKENEKKAMDASSRPLDLGVLPQNDTTNSSSTPAPPPQAWHRPPGSSLPLSVTSSQPDDARMKELRYLQDMFQDKLDSVVVHMIMEDSDYKVDVALETLFKLAEDGQPREGDDSRLSFKNVYPVPRSNVALQEAWGAAPPPGSNAAAALGTSSILQELAKSHQKNHEDEYPALPSKPIDSTQGLLPGMTPVQQKPAVNGIQTSSSMPGLPNQTSTISTANIVPQPTSVVVDNLLDSSSSNNGARPKSNANSEVYVEQVRPKKESAPLRSTEYFRLPLPNEVEEAASYNFYFSDIDSGAGTPPELVGHEQAESPRPASTLGSFVVRKSGKKQKQKPSNLVPKLEPSTVKDFDTIFGQEMEDKGQGNEPRMKLVQGQELVFPVDDSLGGILDEPLEKEKSFDDSDNPPKIQSNLIGAISVPIQPITAGITADECMGTPEDQFLAEIEKEISVGENLPQLSNQTRMMTNVDDDLISRSGDDQDQALIVEKELTNSSQKPELPKPVGPPKKLEWQKSFNENEEWEKLMKEIDASAETIHEEPIAESVQDFIRENTPAATVDKWFSPVSDTSEEPIKALFPEYRLFPSFGPLGSLDINQDGSSDGNDDEIAIPPTKSKILSKIKAANDKKEEATSEDDMKETIDDKDVDRGANQLPVIKAELSVAAKEFVPRPTPDEPPEKEDSESPSSTPPIPIPISHPAPMMFPPASGTPPPRPPYSVSGPPVTQMTYAQPPFSVPGPYRVIGPNQMHPMAMPPFQGRLIRPSPPHMMPLPPGARPRMPMGPHGARPPGGIPPMGYPPRKQPLLPDPGIPPRPLQPRMPPGGPRMVALGNQPPPMHRPPGMQPRFPAPGSPQHRPSGPFRHPPVTAVSGSPSPPFRPNGSPSPQPRQGLTGAPRWPKIQSTIVRRSSDTPPPDDKVKLLPSDKKVLCLMRGLPGSGKTTLARKLKGDKGVIYSSDDYFMRNGRYIYDQFKLNDAHEWNQKRVRTACEEGIISPIIIDNTNCKCWEMRPYAVVAKKNGYHVEIREPTTYWKNNLNILAKKNSHNVPYETIERMQERYEHNVTVENIVRSKKKTKNTPEQNADQDKKSVQKETIKDSIEEKKQTTFETQSSAGSEVAEEMVSVSEVESQQSLPQDLLFANDNNDESKTVLIEAETQSLPRYKISAEIIDDLITATVAEVEQSLPPDYRSSVKEDTCATDTNIADDESDGRKDVLQVSIPMEIFKVENKEDNSADDLSQSENENVETDECKSEFVDHENDKEQDQIEGKVMKESSNVVEHYESNNVTSVPCVEVQNKLSPSLEVKGQISSDSLVLSHQKEDLNVDENTCSGSEMKQADANVISSVDMNCKEITETLCEKTSNSDGTQETPEESHKTLSISSDVAMNQTLIGLQKARQYALNITKNQSIKYTDAPCSNSYDKLKGKLITTYSDSPCSQCVDKLAMETTLTSESHHDNLEAPWSQHSNESHASNPKYVDSPCSNCSDNLDGAISSDHQTVSNSHDLDMSKKPSICNGAMKDDTMSYTDAEELDSVEIVLTDNPREIVDSNNLPSEDLTSEPSYLVQKESSYDEQVNEEGEQSQFEDFDSDGSDLQKTETSSNVSFATASQGTPESVNNECKINDDNESGERKDLDGPPSGVNTKGNQMQSPRLAAVFSELSPSQEKKSTDWFFPGFDDDKVKLDEQNRDELTDTAQIYVDHGCQTQMDEFAILQKLESRKLTSEQVCEMGYKVLIGHTDVYLDCDDQQIDDASQNDQEIPSVPKFDKSTMTDDAMRERSLSSNLVSLQSCFPNVLVDSLQDVLNVCGGDVEWATNILIESGYTTEDTPVQNVNFRYDVEEIEKVYRSVEETNDHDEVMHNVGEMLKVKHGLTKHAEETIQPHVSGLLSNLNDFHNSFTVDFDNSGDFDTTNSTKVSHQLSDADTKQTISQNSSKLHVQSILSSNFPNNEVTCQIIKKDAGTENHTRPQENIPSGKVYILEGDQLQSTEFTEKDLISNPNLHHHVGSLNVQDGGSTGDAGHINAKCSEISHSINQGLITSDNYSNDEIVQAGVDAHKIGSGYNIYNQKTQISHSDVDRISKEKNVPDSNSDAIVTVPLELLVSSSAKSQKNMSSANSHVSMSSANAVVDTQDSYYGNKVLTSSPQCVRSLFNSSTDHSKHFSKPIPSTSIKTVEEIEKGYSIESSEKTDSLSKEKSPVHSVTSSSAESSPKRSLEALSDDDDDTDSGMTALDVFGLDDGMVLQLDAAFALQLQEMFGPVGFHLTPDGLSDQDLEVKITHGIAKELHTLWAATLQSRFDEEQKQMEKMITADEQLARKLQEEESLLSQMEAEKKQQKALASGARPKTKQKKTKPLLLGSPHNLGMFIKKDANGSTQSWWQQLEMEDQLKLQEIMDEQTARQIFEGEESSNLTNEETVHTLAVKIKRNQLYQQFPTMDRLLLDDIFAKHEYELRPTVRDIEKILGDEAPPKDVYTDEELIRLEKQQMELAEKASLAHMQQMQLEKDQKEITPTATSYQSLEDPEYHDYRTEATLHYQQRQECFHKAAAAYQRGLKDLASFYSRQGHQHTELLKAANKRASEAIMEARHDKFDENVLDLHGLHVEEAIETLAEVLQERTQQSYTQTNTSEDIPPMMYRPSHLLIITGRGKNSRGGVARIKPAVANYLKNNNYRFTIPNAGLIKVLW